LIPLRAQDDAQELIARIEAPQSPNRQGLDGFNLPELMRRLHVPGLSIAVIRDFKIHWLKAYGIADVESGRPVEINTLFQAASISKPVTAMAAMRLVDEHRLSLDDDINTILKSWHVHGHAVTPRSLMSHTSGADDGFGFPGYDPSVPRPTLVQILDGKPPSNVGPVLFARPPYQAYKYASSLFGVGASRAG
jgi:CubicO group peptidase (beta-lactamase class C family)